MLTMNFKELEGKILSYLPKDKGLNPTPVEMPELREIRVNVQSVGASGGYATATVKIEERKIGDVRMAIGTESSGAEDPGNAAVWASLKGQIQNWYNKMKGMHADGANVPLIIDPGDSKAPYQFMIKVMDMARIVGVERIEFAGSGEFHEFERFEK
jgi:hypothetical protein